MKTIGLIGGMSWQSSAEYYRLINTLVCQRLGGQNNARSILVTLNFADIERLQHQGDWKALAQQVIGAAHRLEAAGVDFIVLCTNTMHKLASGIESAVSIPLLHIADATADALRKKGIRIAALLGTRFTMEESFYRDRLRMRHELAVHVPEPADREFVHRAIYDELCQGVVRDETRARFRKIITDLVDRGAEAIILGCTELGLLISAADSPVPLFDTTRIHAAAAVAFALNSDKSDDG